MKENSSYNYIDYSVFVLSLLFSFFFFCDFYEETIDYNLGVTSLTLFFFSLFLKFSRWFLKNLIKKNKQKKA